MDPVKVDTWKIPPFGDPGALRGAGSSVSTEMGNVKSKTDVVQTTWSGLAAHYHAPESGTVLGMVKPGVTDGGVIQAAGQKISTALSSFADTIETLETTRKSIEEGKAALERDAEAFESDGNPFTSLNWRNDRPDLAQREKDLQQQVEDLIKAWETAQTTCADAVKGLFAGVKPRQGTSMPDIDTAPPAAQPAPQPPKKEGGWMDVVTGFVNDPVGSLKDAATSTWNGVKGVAGGFWDGAVETWNGFADMTGIHGMDKMKETWGGMVTLGKTAFTAVNPWADPKARADAQAMMKEVGKALIDLETWKTDPAKAFGKTLFNVASVAVGSGAGALLKGAATAAKVASTAEKVSMASKAINAVTKVADIAANSKVVTGAVKIADKVMDTKAVKLATNTVKTVAESKPVKLVTDLPPVKKVTSVNTIVKNKLEDAGASVTRKVLGVPDTPSSSNTTKAASAVRAADHATSASDAAETAEKKTVPTSTRTGSSDSAATRTTSSTSTTQHETTPVRQTSGGASSSESSSGSTAKAAGGTSSSSETSSTSRTAATGTQHEASSNKATGGTSTGDQPGTTAPKQAPTTESTSNVKAASSGAEPETRTPTHQQNGATSTPDAETNITPKQHEQTSATNSDQGSGSSSRTVPDPDSDQVQAKQQPVDHEASTQDPAEGANSRQLNQDAHGSTAGNSSSATATDGVGGGRAGGATNGSDDAVDTNRAKSPAGDEHSGTAPEQNTSTTHESVDGQRTDGTQPTDSETQGAAKTNPPHGADETDPLRQQPPAADTTPEVDGSTNAADADTDAPHGDRAPDHTDTRDTGNGDGSNSDVEGQSERAADAQGEDPNTGRATPPIGDDTDRMQTTPKPDGDTTPEAGTVRGDTTPEDGPSTDGGTGPDDSSQGEGVEADARITTDGDGDASTNDAHGDSDGQTSAESNADEAADGGATTADGDGAGESTPDQGARDGSSEGGQDASEPDSTQTHDEVAGDPPVGDHDPRGSDPLSDPEGDPLGDPTGEPEPQFGPSTDDHAAVENQKIQVPDDYRPITLSPGNDLGHIETRQLQGGGIIQFELDDSNRLLRVKGHFTDADVRYSRQDVDFAAFDKSERGAAQRTPDFREAKALVADQVKVHNEGLDDLAAELKDAVDAGHGANVQISGTGFDRILADTFDPSVDLQGNHQGAADALARFRSALDDAGSSGKWNRDVFNSLDTADRRVLAAMHREERMINLFPQLSSVNRGEFFQRFEDVMLTEHPDGRTFEVTLFRETDSTMPSSVRGDYQFSSATKVTREYFDNQIGVPGV